jgi:hypothetical protein
MSHKFSFTIDSQDRKRPMPRSVIIGRKENETVVHVALKLFGFMLFFRDRLRIEPRLHDDAIPFEPDLIQLDYEMRPQLWVECGECSLNKLDKLAVKCPEAELWAVRRSFGELDDLLVQMRKHDLRRGRYGLVGLDAEMFDEIIGLMGTRNNVMWLAGDFEEKTMQFDFNGLWFDAPFRVEKF